MSKKKNNLAKWLIVLVVIAMLFPIIVSVLSYF